MDLEDGVKISSILFYSNAGFPNKAIISLTLLLINKHILHHIDYSAHKLKKK